MKMKRWISLLLAMLMMVCCFAGCGSAEKEESATGGTSKANDAKTYLDYQDANVGITTGTYAATIIHDVFPEATIKEFASIPDMMLALTQGKVDIVLNDVSYYTCMKWDGMNVDRLEEPYTTTNFGVAFKKEKTPNSGNR